MTHEKCYDVVVVGGAIAGSSIATLLARSGVSVSVVEQRQLPAHKLCGEFLSTEVAGLLQNLGMWEKVLDAGAVPIRRVWLTAPRTSNVRAALPGTAYGFSRFALDRMMLDHARQAGAEVSVGEAVTGVEGNLLSGFTVTTPQRVLRARFVVGAYGRRSTCDRLLRPNALQKRSPLVAFKAHFEGHEPGSVIELHTFRGGYCGLNAVEGGRICVCWLTTKDALTEAGGSPEDMMARSFRDNPALMERVRKLRSRDGRFYSAAQLDFRPKSVFASDVCLVGDAAGMIAPLCGDGMAMAIQSSSIVEPLVRRFLNGRIDPTELRTTYRKQWTSLFRRRLLVGQTLHSVLMHPAAAHAGLSAGRRWPSLLRWTITQTRDVALSRLHQTEAGI